MKAGGRLADVYQRAVLATRSLLSSEPVAKRLLHLLVDSTGIKVEGEGAWHTRKHGGSKRRVWRKIHLGIEEETLEIRVVEGKRCIHREK